MDYEIKTVSTEIVKTEVMKQYSGRNKVYLVKLL